MKEKMCTKCKEFKSLEDFCKDKCSKDGLNHWCKECSYKEVVKYHRTKIGLITQMYASQKYSSKLRNDILPEYSKQELKDWLFDQILFHDLFESWEKSNYNKMLIPSIDRLNDYKGYSFGNIQLTTWHQNKTKGHIDRKNGKNNKRSKSVTQYDKQGNFIKEYYSIMQAERETGINNGNIANCCVGKMKTAGKFIWK